MRAIALALTLLLSVPAGIAHADESPKPSLLESVKRGWSEFSAGEKIVAVGFGMVVGGMAGTVAVVAGAPAVALGATYVMSAGALTALTGLGVLFGGAVRSSIARDRKEAQERAEREGFNGSRSCNTLCPPASLRAPSGAGGADGAGIRR